MTGRHGMSEIRTAQKQLQWSLGQPMVFCPSLSELGLRSEEEVAGSERPRKVPNFDLELGGGIIIRAALDDHCRSAIVSPQLALGVERLCAPKTKNLVSREGGAGVDPSNIDLI